MSAAYQVWGGGPGGDVPGEDAGQGGARRLAAVGGPQDRREVGRVDRVRVRGDQGQDRVRVGGAGRAQQAFLVGGEAEGRTVLGLAAVDVRVVARDDEHHVRRLRDPGHRVLAALGDHHLEDVRALFGNLHAVGGDRDMATRTDVQQEVTVLVGFQAECLLDDPASGLVGGGADIAVVGDREVTAVGGAEGEDALAPVDESEFGAGRVGSERGQVGAANEQGRVQRAFGAAYFVFHVRQRDVQEGALEGSQENAVHALRELDALDALGAEPLVQTLQRGGAVDQRAAVPVEFALVREQTDHGETGVVGQRQQVVVLEEDHRLLRCLLGEGPVRRGVEVLGAGVRVVVRVELAEPEPHRELPADRRVDVGLGQQALVQRSLDPGHDRRTVRAVIGEAVHTGQQRSRRRLLVGVEVVLRVDQIGGRARVRADQEVLVGPGAQLLAQIRRHVVRAAVDQVVGGHHARHRTRLDRLTEGTQVVLVQDARAHRGRRDVAPRLVVVGQPVLEDGRRAPVRRVVAAQAARVGGGDRRGQLGVLGIALLVTAPQRVAQQIHRRGPHVEADAVVAGPHRAHLLGHRVADPSYEILVPGRAQAHRLREDRRRAHPRDAVQGLLAGAERGDTEALHSGRVLVQEADLLAGGEPRQQVVDALRERQSRIAERRRRRRLCGHVGFPLRWSGEALSKRFDADSMRVRCQETFTDISSSTYEQVTPCTTEESWKRPLCTPGCSLNLAATSKRFD